MVTFTNLKIYKCNLPVGGIYFPDSFAYICGLIWTLNSRNTSHVLNAVMNYQVSLNTNEADTFP